MHFWHHAKKISTSISGAIVGQGHMAKRIDQINTY
jgi:hypothetical protein